jgi:hypothetical protein
MAWREGKLWIYHSEYIAENEWEKKLLKQLFKGKLNCDDCIDVIHLICTVTVAEVREE